MGLTLILGNLPLFPLSPYSGGGLGWGFFLRAAKKMRQTLLDLPGQSHMAVSALVSAPGTLGVG